MDLGSVIGIILCFSGVFGGYFMEALAGGMTIGAAIKSLIQPSAMLIIFPGSIGSTMLSVPWSVTKNVISITMKAFIVKETDPQEIIERVIKYVNISRTNGIIALDSEIKNEPNQFLREGIQLVVDGQEINVVKDFLRVQMESCEERHEMGSKFYNNWGGFLPTFGIIGTVMGLISVLGTAGKDPSNTGALISGIAVAFVATFFGVLFANGIALPIGSKLQTLSAEEMLLKNMMLEGILSLQAAENPRVVRDKLNAFLSPSQRKSKEKEG